MVLRGLKSAHRNASIPEAPHLQCGDAGRESKGRWMGKVAGWSLPLQRCTQKMRNRSSARIDRSSLGGSQTQGHGPRRAMWARAVWSGVASGREVVVV